MGLNIGEVTQGFSRVGAEDYKHELNHKAITETKEKIGQTSKIKEATEKGWQGDAQIRFCESLDRGVNDVKETLTELKEALEGQFGVIAEAWVKQDKDMMPED